MSDWLAGFAPEDRAGAAWLAIGLAGQALFFSRWLVQWIVSEARGASVMPLAFWWLSLSGSLIVLAYAVREREPVLALGQTVGFTVYSRNLLLIARGGRRGERGRAAAENVNAENAADAEHAGPIAERSE